MILSKADIYIGVSYIYYMTAKDMSHFQTLFELIDIIIFNQIRMSVYQSDFTLTF